MEDVQSSAFLNLQLKWFESRFGQVVDYPAPLESGALLATRAKGIYKPEGSPYALSIRRQISSNHDDGPIVDLRNGGWGFAYHQEISKNPAQDDESLFTNRSLVRCLEDGQPIGVMNQVESKETSGISKYLVLGLGRVIAKVGDFFLIADLKSAKTIAISELIGNIVEGQAESGTQFRGESSTDFDEYDDRVRVMRSIVARRGQGGFRADLLSQYREMCAISSCNVVAILDAAHIHPYKGEKTNALNNGLILRTDLHSLFDLDLLGIEPQSLRVVVSKMISESCYREFDRVTLRSPIDAKNAPFLGALEYRWKKFISRESEL